MRPHQSCEAVQPEQTVKCPAGRQAHWWSWPQIIRSTGEQARRAHRQTTGTGWKAWSPRARRVWWTRRASLRATEITPRWPSARRLTARKWAWSGEFGRVAHAAALYSAQRSVAGPWRARWPLARLLSEA